MATQQRWGWETKNDSGWLKEVDTINRDKKEHDSLGNDSLGERYIISLRHAKFMMPVEGNIQRSCTI